MQPYAQSSFISFFGAFWACQQENTRLIRVSLQDIVVIIFSSFASLLHIGRSPSSSGYVRADTGTRGGFIGAIGGRRGPGRRSEVDAENRLIDQLDEEWED